ncbi:hypothetical protein [Gracilibacillus halophilus]|uniref:hypothetical protein n=1 Tax=Gracilibacillus halophilus TaxID=470864 RepID=UPI0012EA4463|nr:hypothetical protein [Gracilibacillus halophilus]
MIANKIEGTKIQFILILPFRMMFFKAFHSVKIPNKNAHKLIFNNGICGLSALSIANVASSMVEVIK